MAGGCQAASWPAAGACLCPREFEGDTAQHPPSWTMWPKKAHFETWNEPFYLLYLEKLFIDLSGGEADSPNNMFCTRRNQKAEGLTKMSWVQIRSHRETWLVSGWGAHWTKWKSLTGYSRKDGPVMCTRTMYASLNRMREGTVLWVGIRLLYPLLINKISTGLGMTPWSLDTAESYWELWKGSPDSKMLSSP